MAAGKVNEQILKAVKEHSGDDKALETFLTELLYEEAEHTSRWHSRKVYQRKAERLAPDWVENLED